MDNIAENNILELHMIAEDEMDIPTPSPGSENPQSDETNTPKEAKIWAYLGVVGGAGVTSLAVQTAWELSSMETDGELAKVLLVDLDFERGDCAAYLDTEPSISLDELNETEGRMDENLAETFIRPINTNLSLLSAGSQMGGNDLLSTNALLSLLDVLSSQFDFVILDVPPMWRTWTQAVIGAADKFALVVESRVPALHLAKKLAEDISEAMSLDNLPDIIINKYERRPLSGGLSLRDVHKVLERETCSQISVDDETLRIAINTGKPAGVLKPKGRYSKSVREHVKAWRNLDLEVEGEVQTEPRRRKRRVARG